MTTTIWIVTDEDGDPTVFTDEGAARAHARSMWGVEASGDMIATQTIDLADDNHVVVERHILEALAEGASYAVENDADYLPADVIDRWAMALGEAAR